MVALTSAVAISAGLVGLPQVTNCLALSADSYVFVPLGSSRVEGRLWVECMVCNRPVRLVIDTGSGQTILVPSLATQLGLRLEAAQQGSFANGIKSEVRASEINLKIGNLTIDSFVIGVMDLTAIFDLDKKVEGLEFAGLLGTDFLARYDALIDYRSRRLYFRDTPAKERAALQGNWRATGFVHHGLVRDDHDYVKGCRVVVKENTFEFVFGTKRSIGTLTLDTGERPEKIIGFGPQREWEAEGRTGYLLIRSSRRPS